MLFNQWKQYFQLNQTHFNHINWLPEPELSPQEKNRITTSIQQFQRGEHSEGKNLFRFARLMKDDSYIEAIKLFICEEQRHAAVLAKFMRKEKIPLIRADWVDFIFRKIRVLATLENSVLILITAEIVAAVYYKALAKATASPTLNALCIQILKDEAQHLSFQSRALNVFYERRNPLGKSFIKAFHFLLIKVTLLLVWTQHKSVLQAAFSFHSFATAINEEYRNCREMIEGVRDTDAITEVSNKRTA